MISKISSNYFESWQIYWQNKKGISSIGTHCSTRLVFAHCLARKTCICRAVQCHVFKHVYDKFAMLSIDVKNLEKGIKNLKNQDLTLKIKNLKKP